MCPCTVCGRLKMDNRVSVHVLLPRTKLEHFSNAIWPGSIRGGFLRLGWQAECGRIATQPGNSLQLRMDFGRKWLCMDSTLSEWIAIYPWNWQSLRRVCGWRTSVLFAVQCCCCYWIELFAMWLSLVRLTLRDFLLCLLRVVANLWLMSRRVSFRKRNGYYAVFVLWASVCARAIFFAYVHTHTHAHMQASATPLPTQYISRYCP